MAYKVTISSQAGPVIETTYYDTLDEALEAATFGATGGVPVLITVHDEDGAEVFRRLHNA